MTLIMMMRFALLYKLRMLMMVLVRVVVMLLIMIRRIVYIENVHQDITKSHVDDKEYKYVYYIFVDNGGDVCMVG